MILCQISDLHIKPGRRLAYGIVDTAAMLERCVRSILDLAQPPDAVIATGDLVDLGRPEASFPEHGYLRQWQPFVQYAIEDHPVRLVALDTVVPGRGDGALCRERLDWLDRCLSEQPRRPTIVALHHPPFATGIGHMDRIGLAGADGLRDVIARHPQVERLIAGHLHRPILVRFGGTVASTCPSPAHQVALDLAHDAADDFVMEPPAYQLHLWTGGSLVTHTAYVGEFAGPFPFRENGRLID